MKMLAMQIPDELHFALRKIALEQTTTLRGLCTGLLLDGLKHWKPKEIAKLAQGTAVPRGRPPLPPEVKAERRTKKLDAQAERRAQREAERTRREQDKAKARAAKEAEEARLNAPLTQVERDEIDKYMDKHPKAQVNIWKWRQGFYKKE